MEITANHVMYKKRIGKVGDVPVYEIATTGGLHMILKASGANGKPEMLGTGSHRAIARHIAKRKEPRLELNELSKSDWLDPNHYAHLLPKYEELTDRMRALQV